MLECIIFELFIEFHEVNEFIGVSDEISFDDEGEEFYKHKIFGIEFTDGVVNILDEFLIIGSSIMDSLFFGELSHKLRLILGHRIS